MSHRSARHVPWWACNDPTSAKRFHRYVHFRVTPRAAPGHTVARRTRPESGAAPLSAVPEVATGEEMAVKRIRISRPGIRRERPGLEVLPADPRDPDVVRAKALTGPSRPAPIADSLADPAMPDAWSAGCEPQHRLMSWAARHLAGQRRHQPFARRRRGGQAGNPHGTRAAPNQRGLTYALPPPGPRQPGPRHAF